MYIQNLDEWVNNIQVRNMVNEDVEVVNSTSLIMMGKGRQGAVFQINDDICVKVFGNSEDCEREYYALTLGQQSNLFPKLYGKGKLYVAMEIIKGVDVREYLQSQPLTRELSAKLIDMLITFKMIGYDRIDHHKRQIYLQPDGNIRVIDVARTVWRDRVYPYPRKLLTSLGEKNKELFLSHVQEMAPKLYEEWMHYIRMEELSRQITQIMLPKAKESQTVKSLSKRLITTKDENIYVVMLEGLVHKVFKEEWIKTMLARGADPDAVMLKIDEYWYNLEQDFQERHPNGYKHFEGERRHKEERRYEEDRRYKEDRRYEEDRRYKEDRRYEEDRRYKEERRYKEDRHSDKGKHYDGEKNREHNKHQYGGKRFEGERQQRFIERGNL